MVTIQVAQKKPVQIKAVQFTGKPGELHSIMGWMEKNGYDHLIGNAADPDDNSWPDKGIYIDPATGLLMIRTLEGDVRVSIGDWIIQGVEGEFYPCKDSIFVKTYDIIPF